MPKECSLLKREHDMGVNEVTAWARRRLAEQAHAAPTPASAPAPAPARAVSQARPTADDDGPRVMAMPGAKDEGPAPDWRALDKAYLLHHMACPVCQAAGRGARYGMRCGTGASLWSAYSEAQPLHLMRAQQGITAPRTLQAPRNGYGQ